MTRGEALFLLIAGFLMGTIFTFGMQYWNAPVTREDALCATAVYESYSEQVKRSDVKEITLRFKDHRQLYIDGVCISKDLRKQIHALAPGTQLSLMIHPNSSTIMELKVGDSVLLEFQSTAEKLSNEASGFMVIGLFCYAASLCGLVKLLFGKKS